MWVEINFINLMVQNYNILSTQLTRYEIAFSLLKGIGPVRAAQLYGKLDSLELIFKMTKKELRFELGLTELMIQELNRDEALRLADEQMLFNEKHQVQTHFFLGDTYPRRLKQCADAPIVVFSQGNVDLNALKMISVVGTRNITPYGQKIVGELIESLKGQDIVVVSGLAYGVDILVHQLCLENDIPTIGVLGHGLDRIYPHRHRKVAAQMKEQGALMTEFLIHTNPDRENFPMRNRIVAGMSDATVVVESKKKGGSIITAELANDYNRDVFAYPGDVDRPFSEGCNWLISKQKAHLITHSDDFLTFMNWKRTAPKVKSPSLFVELSEQDRKVVNIILEEREVHADVISLKTGLPPSMVNVVLFNLEMQNIVRQIPGKRFSLA
jgi:DNA processing protein